VIDTNALMRETLLSAATPAGAALAAQVNGRVYMGQFPQRDKWQNAAKSIVAYRSGGANALQTPIYRPRFVFECYGGSSKPMDADAVYRALHDRLEEVSMEAHPSGVVMNMEEEVSADDTWDEDREWPYALTIWTAEMREG
jgi:hypothetical protein